MREVGTKVKRICAYRRRSYSLTCHSGQTVASGESFRTNTGYVRANRHINQILAAAANFITYSLNRTANNHVLNLRLRNIINIAYILSVDC